MADGGGGRGNVLHHVNRDGKLFGGGNVRVMVYCITSQVSFDPWVVPLGMLRGREGGAAADMDGSGAWLISKIFLL